MDNTKLIDDLLSMADDLQISGDANFRGLANAVKLRGDSLTPDERKHVLRLLRRANKFMEALSEFWAEHADLDELVDQGEVLASDGLQYAERKLRGE